MNMKVMSINRLSKVVEFTKDREVFNLRLKYYGIKDFRITNLLWKIYKLVHFTDYPPLKVKEALSKGEKYADVAEKYGVKEGTIKKEVHDFGYKLQKLWGGDIWEMIENEEIEGEDVYVKELERIVDDSLSNCNVIVEDLVEDKFVVDVFSYADLKEDFKEISNEDYHYVKNLFSGLSKKVLETKIGNADKYLVSYGVYLLVTPERELTDLEKERKKELLLFTKLRDDVEYLDHVDINVYS